MDTLLNPDPGIYIWTVVCFLGLVALLKAFAWGPLLAAVEAREAAMRREREGAEAARAEAEKIRAELAARMAELSARSKVLLEAAQADAEKARAELRRTAEAEAGAIVEKAREQLGEEKRRLVSELRKDVAELSVEGAERLMRRSVDPGVRKAVLDDFLSDLSKRTGSNFGMQASDRVLARRYAKALFLAAAEEGSEDRTGSELRAVAAQLRARMGEFRSPRDTAEQKKERLRQAAGASASKTALRFLELLLDKKRIGLLERIAEDYALILDEHRGTVRAEVRSAAELSKEESAALAQGLGSFFRGKVEAEVAVEPGLLAGVRVRVGDWVLDGSLKGRLERLRGALSRQSQA